MPAWLWAGPGYARSPLIAQSRQEAWDWVSAEVNCFCYVDVEADWGGEPARAQNVTLTPRIEAEASEAEILDLIAHTDRVAEIPNSLRLGTPVKLINAQAIEVQT